ncbi:uncharacterized protein LOC113334015 [Papaver somniferum]|uniref:uncharacterized protein LOC113334015 n=1 Tax=Papaver somniferum TaxID=3469 RepID=UPI000E6FD3EC|nr:uncharacterized protein LOC113334015 [Papaver somniferum]
MVTPVTLTIDVWNCTTHELLSILPPVIEHCHPLGVGNGYLPMSCGFGLDSINNEYKFVFFVIMLRTKALKCLVYTFGIRSSWTEVSLPAYHYPTENHASRLATFASYGGGGGGALFWRTRDPQVILLFDLHEHKLENIRLPPERDEYRLFELKGFLGVAILEKKSLVGTSTTATLEKVHLEILKAYKHRQVWVKLETIDISSYSIPFTRNSLLVSISVQVLLYWTDTCKGFQLFNLHMQCLQVVKNLDASLFDQFSLRHWLTGLDHYWLHCEVENICSLKTLLPQRARRVPNFARLDLITKNGCQQMWFMTKPKTVLGGVFTSYYQSKSNEHYWFNAPNAILRRLDQSTSISSAESQFQYLSNCDLEHCISEISLFGYFMRIFPMQDTKSGIDFLYLDALKSDRGTTADDVPYIISSRKYTTLSFGQ